VTDDYMDDDHHHKKPPTVASWDSRIKIATKEEAHFS
jgi:hypothetical protein